MPVLHPQLALHAVVNGITGVRVFDDPAEVAVGVAYGISELVGPSRSRHPGSGARCQPGWNQFAKSIGDQWQKIWVPIDFLEIAQIVVSDVTDFRRHPVAELVLDAEVPLLRVGIAEVGPELHLCGKAGISLWRQRKQRGSDARAVKRGDAR